MKSTISNTIEDLGESKSNIDQVVISMEQMTLAIAEVAKNASYSAATASKADIEVQQGNIVVGETVDLIKALAHGFEETTQVMDELRQDSDNIGSVLAVIEDIAGQTNLLALNAASDALRSITSIMNEIDNMNAQVASAAEEQSATMNEVNNYVGNIKTSINSIVEMSECAQLASNSLTNTSDDLNSYVSKFDNYKV